MSKTTTTPAESVELDDLTGHLELLRTIEDQLARLKRLRGDLQNTLKRRLGDIEVGTVNGVPMVTYRATLRIGLSQTLLKERYPQIVRECEEITSVRTFLLVDAA
ncbi:hypothetical protein Q5530_12415 [Saccharothrix sp. BKS2]|uniref:hypothetical protein n=1 Tax=Saccharothrix sp. BKS2 TaxID=3064400 RepID=UPI0039EBD5F2